MKHPYSEIHRELRWFARLTPKITYTNRNVSFFHRFLGTARVSPPPEDIHLYDEFIPSQKDQPQLRLRIYKPTSTSNPTPVLLWLHGGGYVMGTPEQDDPRCTQFVRELGVVIVSVDYRMAPQYPFPAALDDAYAALLWIAAHAQQLNIDPSRIVLAGVSAGGGLAASLTQLAHDRKEIKPAFQLLIFPMLDDRTVLRGDDIHCANVIWNQQSNRFGWEAYLNQPCGSAETPSYAVAAHREDLSDLPPAWIGVGTLDIFHDESVAYAQRLQAAGVPCELVQVPGAFHGFDIFNADLPVVRGFRESQITALKSRLIY